MGSPPRVSHFGAIARVGGVALVLSLGVTSAQLGCGGTSNTGGMGGEGSSNGASSDSVTASISSHASSSSGPKPLPLACQSVIELSDPAVVSGTTIGLLDSIVSGCEQSGAGEVAYHFVAATTGLLHVELESPADLGLYARSECGNSGSEVACADNRAAGQIEKMDVDVREGESLFIFVDGYVGGEQGPYTLRARSLTPGCGDRIVFGAEQCDPPDGLTCDQTCHLLPEACDDGVDNDKDGFIDCEDPSCAGDPSCDFATFCSEASPIVSTTTIGSTVGAPANFSGSCTGLGAPEKVWRYSPATSGVLGLTLSSTADLSLHVRDDCAVPSSELGCVDSVSGGVAEHLSVPAIVGHPVTVFVDGKPGQSGAFSLQSILTPFTEMEPNDSRPQANPFTEPFTASVYPSFDADWIRFTVPQANGTLTAEILDVGNGDCANQVIDSQVEILAPDGITSLAFNDDTPNDYCSKAVAAIPAPGSYYVRVAASQMFAPTLTFIYRLKLTLQ